MSVTESSGRPTSEASSVDLRTACSSATVICKAAVSDVGPPDRARSITRSPLISPKRDSTPSPTVKYARPTLSPSKMSTIPPVAVWRVITFRQRCMMRAGGASPRHGVSPARECLRQTLASGATLQPFQNVGQSLVTLPVYEVKIYPCVSKRAPEAKDQREFLRSEVVSVFHERCG